MESLRRRFSRDESGLASLLLAGEVDGEVDGELDVDPIDPDKTGLPFCIARSSSGISDRIKDMSRMYTISRYDNPSPF